MDIRDKLIELEEQSHKKCAITLTVDNGLRNGAELCVQNIRCVKSCDENFVVLSVYGMDIHISGTPLILENFGVGSIVIRGRIHSLTFEENGDV